MIIPSGRGVPEHVRPLRAESSERSGSSGGHLRATSLGTLSLAINRELLHQFGGAFLRGDHSLRAQKEVYDVLVARLPGRTRNFHQLIDQTRKLFPGGLIVSPPQLL